MMSETITYEEPAGEPITMCLRIESLLQQAVQTSQKPNSWCSHMAMLTLFDLLRITERHDLKISIAKELQRHLANLLPLTHSSNIDQKKLQIILAELEGVMNNLHASQGKFGQNLRDNEFFKTASQLLYPAMTYSFESPAYYQWLQQNPEHRIHDLKIWLQEFALAQEAVSLLLRIIRDSSHPKIYTAEKASFQLSLNSNTNCQLVRITLPKSTNVFPRISITRHRVAVQFYVSNLAKPPTLITEDVSFQMSCCAS